MAYEQKRRFISYIIDEPERFLPYVEKENPNIKDFGDLETAFRKAFSLQDKNITSDELTELFDTPQVEKIIRENTTEKEFEDLYRKRRIIPPRPKKEIVTIRLKTIKQRQSSGKIYARKIHVGKGYYYTPVEDKFISVRRKKGLSYKQITSDFNKAFPDKKRTEQGIKFHSYRMK